MSIIAKSVYAVGALSGWLLSACVPLYAGDIHDAVRKNDFKTVRTLIAENPDLVHSRDSDGCTPLHDAAQYSVPEIVSFLVARGADVNARSRRGSTPLWFTDDAEIAEILIEHGAKLTTDSNGDTELDYAVQDQNLLLVDVLVKAGGKLTFEQLAELGRTEEVSAALKEQRLTAVELAAALHAAAFNGHLETVRVLLEHGADPNLNDVGDDGVPTAGFKTL